MIQHYLTTAWRQLMKYKAQNLIALLGLGLALLCFSVCLHVSRYMFNVNESIENRDRIARVKVKQIENDKVLSMTSSQLAAELRTKGLHNVDFCAVYENDNREYNVVFHSRHIFIHHPRYRTPAKGNGNPQDKWSQDVSYSTYICASIPKTNCRMCTDCLPYSRTYYQHSQFLLCIGCIFRILLLLRSFPTDICVGRYGTLCTHT